MDLIYFTQVENIPALVISVDFEKAFDTLCNFDTTSELPEVVQANNYLALEKIKNIVKLWSMITLTLFGKITVIKSLLESQLVYKLSVLPTPSQQMLTEIDQNFLISCGTSNHTESQNIWP